MQDTSELRLSFPVLVTAPEIRDRVASIASAIASDLRGEQPHLVCVLKGAFVFTADLLRALPVAATVDFLGVSSYGGGTSSGGEARLTKDLDEPIEGRHVVVVEDIVDTGLTLAYLRRMLGAHHPASLRVAALLSKPSRRRVDVPIEYVGFEIPDRFVVGYGLDHGQLHRHLPDIVAVEEPVLRPFDAAPPAAPR